MNDILFGFKEHLKILGRSPATVEAYCEHVQAWLIATATTDVRRVTRAALEAYIASLHEHRTKGGKPYAVATIAVKVRSIKRFFEHLEQANLVFVNPAEFLREPKKAKTLPRAILTPAEARAILDRPNLGTRKGIRDRAVLEVFYSTGIRLEELCSLGVYDVDLQGALVRITKGKGKKERVVPLGRHAVRFLREYITKVRSHFTRKNRQTRRLFVDTFGKPLSKQVVSISVRTYARAAGIDKQVTAHTFRHSFACALVKNGADLNAVRKMLGHRDLKTTDVYLRSVGIDLKAAHKKSHPREKEREESVKPELERIRPRYERKPKPEHPEP